MNIDPLDGSMTLDAAARRRRMHRRQAKRRLTRVAVVATVVFTAAALITPDRAVVATPKGTSDARGPMSTVRMVASAVAGASLPIQPSWRPAGAVLTRKATQAPSLPFGIDPREVERRESLSRWHRIYTYSTRYRIKPDLARRVYDAAVTAGIEPELGFRLVRVESVFDTKATSPVGAVGLTQLMLGTAREFEPNVTRELLLDPDVNLRIGFKYLRSLIREYKGNLKLALLVYNRGPAAVQNALSLGMDPTNGYESIVMRGYRGRGVLD
ncbi:MAG: transglycosylase SLT domain-containing protein [Gemmatimonadaceae bacterium]|nr:transglycosylase SLT domain-containing protein [Gemmatimonadaceae bacterium]